MRRFLDHDATLGITNFFHYDAADDTFTIEAVQDMEPLVETNKQAFNGPHGSWGDGKVVARVPLIFYDQWMREGKHRDQSFLKRWLNDPDNSAFRVRPGVI